MKFSTTYFMNHLVVINATKSDESNHVSRMIDDLSHIVESSTPGINITKFEINSVQELKDAFLNIEQAIGKGLKPVLHIEVHGNEKEGLIIGDKEEKLPWKEIVDLLRVLNEKLDNNLIVVSCACFSFSSILQIDITRTTPFSVLLAPDREVKIGYLSDHMPSFYRELFKTNNINSAHNIIKGKFSIYYCEKILFTVMKNMTLEQGIGAGHRETKERMLSEALEKLNLTNNKINRKMLRKSIGDFFKPRKEVLDQYSKKFLMRDICSFTITDVVKAAREEKIRAGRNNKDS